MIVELFGLQPKLFEHVGHDRVLFVVVSRMDWIDTYLMSVTLRCERAEVHEQAQTMLETFRLNRARLNSTIFYGYQSVLALLVADYRSMEQ